jgi:HD-like signal output (HDOD) protein
LSALPSTANLTDRAPDGSPGGRDRIALVTRRLASLREAGDMPAMSQVLRDIEELTRGENQNLRQLTRSVMKDLALTQRLLRLVNSSLYRPSGHEAVSTVSRALQVLGLDTVRSLALSLKLFERLGRGRTAARLSDEFTRSTFAAAASRLLLAPGTRLWEEAGLAALFHRLGQVLVINHLPEESRRLDQAGLERLPRAAQRELACEVLGMSFEQLGHAVGQAWGLPEVLLQGLLRSPVRGPVPPCSSPEFTVRVAAGLAVELGEAVDSHGPDPSPAIDALAARYGGSLGLGGAGIVEVVTRARTATVEVGRAMGIEVATTPFGRRLLGLEQPLGGGAQTGSIDESGGAQTGSIDEFGGAIGAGPIADAQAAANADADIGAGGEHEGEWPSATEGATEAQPAAEGPAIGDSPDSLATEPGRESHDRPGRSGEPAVEAEIVAELPARPRPEPSEAAATRELAACVADLAILLADGAAAPRLIRRGLEGIHAALDCDRVLFASPDARGSALFGRFVAGAMAHEDLAATRIPLDGPSDLLSAAVARGADLLITDASAAGVATRLPTWLRGRAAPTAFLLLPLRDGGQVLGAVYADRAARGGFAIDDLGQRLLRALRCQLALALREPANVA